MNKRIIIFVTIMAIVISSLVQMGDYLHDKFNQKEFKLTGVEMIPVFLYIAKERGDYQMLEEKERMQMKYTFNKVLDQFEEENKPIDKRYQEMPLFSKSSVKRYMDYQTITDIGSPQYAIVNNSQIDDNGLLITRDGYVCVALGQEYGKVGDKFLITIGGKDIKCIMADAKAYEDTLDSAGWLDPYGDVLEFVVWRPMLNEACKTMGNMDYCSKVKGPVDRILKEV